MSISILLLSVVFALIEAGLSWLILACPPVTALTAGVHPGLLTGGVFALGMLLSFIVIIVIGLLEIGPRAATFVRGHVGRTMLLGLLSMILVFALGLGAEAVYHVGPYVPAEPVVMNQTADVCFVLDYSVSMKSNNAENNMKTAFEQVINGMPDGQRVCVVGYGTNAYTLQTWTALDASTRASVVGAVKNKDASDGGTNFGKALMEADRQVQQAVNAGRPCAVIMLSDGDCPISSVEAVAPQMISNKIPAYTMYTGDSSTANVSSLQKIADATGGEMRVSAVDLTNLSVNLTEVTHKASNAGLTMVEEDHIPDTLLTGRDEGRMGLFDMRIMRMVMLFIVGFAFKLICVICVGNNSRFIGHFLHAFFVTALAAAAVEFGYAAGLPVIAVIAVFWTLMMNQIVLTR